MHRSFLRAAQAVQKHGESGLKATSLAAANGGAAAISIAIKGGSRYEQSPGVASLIAAAKHNTSASHNSYLQCQQLQHAGATVTAEAGRDHIVFTLRCGPKLIAEMFEDVVAPAIFNSETWQWELTELEKSLSKSNAKSCDMLDLLHSVSFKGSLANAARVPNHRLGSGAMYRPDDSTDHSTFYIPTPMVDCTRITSAEVGAHVAATYKHGNIQVFTSGVTDAQAQRAALIVSEYSAPGAASAAPAATFVSGESRQNTSGAVKGVVGFPGAASGSGDVAAYAVVAAAVGGESHCYEGAGLLAVPTSDPAATVAAIAGLSDAAIEAAKVDAAVNHAFAGNTIGGAVGQSLNGTAGADIAGVSTAAVKSLAANLAKGPKSLAVKGDLSNCAFVSEL